MAGHQAAFDGEAILDRPRQITVTEPASTFLARRESSKKFPMPITHTIENGEVVFRVALDDVTIARLMRLADECHAPPAVVIASIVHDVLLDDEAAHCTFPEPITASGLH